MNVKRSGTDLACAGYCLYSSATVLVLSVGTGVWGFTLDTLAGEFYLTHPDMKIPDPGQRIYSGNEGNTQLWAPELRAYLQVWKNVGRVWGHNISVGCRRCGGPGKVVKVPELRGCQHVWGVREGALAPELKVEIQMWGCKLNRLLEQATSAQ
eukprot:366259-Chlamydomonas_euryale.AAC.17